MKKLEKYHLIDELQNNIDLAVQEIQIDSDNNYFNHDTNYLEIEINN